MRLVMSTVATVAALVVVSSAVAAYQYAPPRQWSPGASAGSTWNHWFANYFMTWGSGYDKTVTFIKNTNYSWVNTKRGTSDYLETYTPLDTLVYKAHCVAHTWFTGSCNVR